MDDTGTNSDSSLIALVLDLNPYFFRDTSKQGSRGLSGGGLTLEEFLNQVLVFCNSFTALNASNELVVVVCSPSDCRFAYPSPSASEENVWVALSEAVHSLFQAELNSASKDHTSKLTAGISMALCYINRQLKVSSGLAAVLSGEAALATERRRSGGARILVLNVSSDLSMKYISFMNCVFSAQKLHVSIDGCCLAKKDSSFLQQAANITGGMYMKIPEEKQGGLLQYLLCMFLPDRLSRKHLILPSSQSIDFRPSCFCHHEKVDVGLVCSVCLSVFCGKEGYFNVCKTCDAKFSETAESKRKRFLL